MRRALEWAIADGLRHLRDVPLAVWLFGPDDLWLLRWTIGRAPAGASPYQVASDTIRAAIRGAPWLPIRGIVVAGRGLVRTSDGEWTSDLCWIGAFTDTAEDLQVTVPGIPDALDPYGLTLTTTTGTVARMLLAEARGQLAQAALLTERAAVAAWN
jgi:hypothetical protein